MSSQPPIPNADLDTLVRRVDEDRWLASRFAPEPVHERLIALYALNYEIAHIGESVREPGLGAIRLHWWREAIEDVIAGKPGRNHPALVAYVHAGMPGAEAMLASIDARALDLEPAPFESVKDIEAYVLATAGAVLRAGFAACGVTASDSFIAAGARSWGLTGLLRAAEHWGARGRTLLPPGVARADLQRRARDAHTQAQGLARDLPAQAFGVFGYLALVPDYLRARAKDGAHRPLFVRQWRLVAASATGRI